MNVNLSYANDNWFVIKVFLLGRPYVALVDTGASHNMIHSAVAKELGLMLTEGDRVSFNMANSSCSAMKYHSTLPVMVMGNGTAAGDAVVVSDTLPFDLLLGVPWLKRVDAGLFVRRMKMVIE